MSPSVNDNLVPRPLSVGLTGGIGCGKTTVLNLFSQMGVPCFEADRVAADYYRDPEFLGQIRQLFGSGVFLPDGSANKAAIARIVFANPQSLSRLNNLVHPRVWNDYLQFARRHSSAPYLIFESAIIYESHLDKLVDKVVCVYLDLHERIRRAAERDHATPQQIQSRIANQIPAEEVMQRADYVILNYEGNPRARQVQHIHQQIISTLPLTIHRS